MKGYIIPSLESLPFFNEKMRKLIDEMSENFVPGKYDMGNGIIANVDPEYMTKSESRYEVHRKMADLVVLISGKEEIWVTETGGLEVLEPYDEERDIAFFAGGTRPKRNDVIKLMHRGDFAIVFPRCGHMPGMDFKGHKNMVKKIVFKIPKELLRRRRTAR